MVSACGWPRLAEELTDGIESECPAGRSGFVRPAPRPDGPLPLALSLYSRKQLSFSRENASNECSEVAILRRVPQAVNWFGWPQESMDLCSDCETSFLKVIF